MNKKVGITISLIIIAGFGVGAWKYLSQSPTIVKPTEKKISITTSFYPLYFFATTIAGERASVINITPAGAEPHDYEPTARDVATIEDSDLLILHGGIMESWGPDIQKNLQEKKTQVITVGQDLFSRDFVDEEGQTVRDPHVWLSPILAKQMVDKILTAIITIDPEGRFFYEQRAETLQQELDTLNTDYKNGLAHCASTNIVTSHAAFGYLVEAYHLIQTPIAGLSPDTEPSPKELASITQFVKTHKVGYIFFESLISPKLAETIATETGAKTAVLNPLEGLTNADIRTGQNYFTVMRQNLDQLRIALQCQ